MCDTYKSSQQMKYEKETEKIGKLFFVLSIFILVFLCCSVYVFSDVSIVNLTLNMTTSNNAVTDNLTCNFDLNDTATSSAVAWYKNGSSTMILYMPMKGNATNAILDYSGTNPTITTYDLLQRWNSSGGKDGKGAFEYYGNSSFSIANSPTLSSYNVTRQITVCAWVKMRITDTAATYRGIVGKFDTTNNKRSFLLLKSPSAMTVDWYNNNLNGATASRKWITSTKSMVPGIWVHICGVNNGTNMSIYWNGTLDIMGSNITDFYSGDAPIEIGTYNNRDSTRFFNGSIADVRIYNYSLSPQQIMALFLNRSDLIVSQELENGEVWNCNVTPFNATKKGSTYTSNTITIGTPSGGEDLIYALFYNFTDNNKTVVDTGTGNFYCQINNTNGTAKLEINGANYTATNTTRNNFNASFIFSYGKVYTYKWWAYGNGTSNNLNSTPTFNYGVNISCIINGTVTFTQNQSTCCNYFKVYQNSTAIFNQGIWGRWNYTIFDWRGSANFWKFIIFSNWTSSKIQDCK